MPTSGELRYRDVDLTHASEAQLTDYRRRHVGFDEDTASCDLGDAYRVEIRIITWERDQVLTTAGIPRAFADFPARGTAAASHPDKIGHPNAIGDWHGTCPTWLETEAPVKLPLLIVALVLTTTPSIAQAQDRQSTPIPARENEANPEQSGLFNEPNVIGRAIRHGSRLMSSGDGGETKNGFYPEFGDMITGSGWLSGGPGYRYWLFNDRMFVDASAALSWRMYKTAQARVELPSLAQSRLTVGAQVRWQDLTQVSYFGDGPDSLETNRSEYRMESSNVIGYVIGKPAKWLSIDGKLGWITRPSIQPPGGTFERGNPDSRIVFPDDPVYQLAEQPNFLHGEIGIVADTRDHRGYPSAGGVYQASWSHYADREIDQFSFHRYEAEAAHFYPVSSHRVVLIAHGWFAGSRADAGQVVPFYLLPTLGGSNSLRSYSSYRFHDRNLLLVNAEARVKLFTHVDWALFADAGNVAPKVGDLNFDRRSYGMGFRVHTRQATVARLDVAHGDEGWRVLFRVNDPFRFSRLSRRTAPLPFVP